MLLNQLEYMKSLLEIISDFIIITTKESHTKNGDVNSWYRIYIKVPNQNRPTYEITDRVYNVVGNDDDKEKFSNKCFRTKNTPAIDIVERLERKFNKKIKNVIYINQS